MVTQYKCPSCGSDLSFDVASGSLKCPSCNRTVPMDQVPKSEGSTDPNVQVDMFNPDDIPDEQSFEYTGERNTAHNEFSENDVQEYYCNNCGAIILADKQTSATSCSFCGSPVMLADRLTGKLAPAKVIPFRITKDEAQAKFKKWCKNGRFTPGAFRNADRVKNITGMYVPFWLFDMNGRGDADATCTRTKSYTRGEYRVTETSYFHVYRKFNLNYQKIPVDASEKMNDDLMDRLEPFDYKDLMQFQMPYLSGFLAEKYDYTDTDLFPRVRNRVNNYVNNYVAGTMSGYSSTRYNRKDIHIQPNNTFYTLLPVWVVYYDFHDSEHVFLMNGQTGKIVGKPPIAKSKVVKWFGILSGISFVALYIIGLIIKMGGPRL